MAQTFGFRSLAFAALLALAASPAWAQVEVDPNLPSYTPVEGISGTIKSVGSDTMVNLMAKWHEAFQKHYPNVTMEADHKGSSQAPPALIEGTADLGAMSRAMKAEEIENFEKAFGYKPTSLETSIDMLAVFVNRNNSIASLTLPQVDAMFSSTRNLGYADDITTWGQLGLKGAFANKPISLYGRNAASGTYGFFKEHVLGKGDFKNTVKEQPGSAAVVQGVASDRFAIGYSGIGYLTADVRAVPLAIDADSDPVEAIPENAYTGDYPLSRYLYVYVNARPNSELPPLKREFVRFIFSREGQDVVVSDGYFPVTADIARRSLESVGIAVEQTAAVE